MEKDIQKEDLLHIKVAGEALKVVIVAALMNMGMAMTMAIVTYKVVAPWEVTLNSKVMAEVL